MGPVVSRPKRTGRAPRPLRTTFLIVCCGHTEKRYFEALCHAVGFAEVDIRVEAKDPRRMITKLTRVVRQRLGSYDQLWAVFDKDDFASFDRLVREGCSVDGQRVGLAFTNPRFELWLLLHFGPWTRDCSGAEIERELCSKAGFERYEHGADVWDLVAHLRDEAVKNAEELEQRRQNDGWAEGSCPSTTVHRLVTALDQG